MLWFDPDLMWNPREYGIFATSVSTDEIWTPDVYLINSASEEVAYSAKQSSAFVFGGQVLANFGSEFQTSCNMDLLYFPHDTQTCSMRFSTLHYLRNQLVINPYNNTLSFGKFSKIIFI